LRGGGGLKKAVVKTAAMLIVALVSLPLMAQPTIWPQASGNSGRTSQSPLPGPLQPVTNGLKVFHTGEPLQSQIVISKEGNLYVRTLNTLFALKPDLTLLAPPVSIGQQGTSPVVDDTRGHVYVMGTGSSGNWELLRFSKLLTNRTVIKTIGLPVPSVQPSELLLADDGTVYWVQGFRPVRLFAAGPVSLDVAVCENENVTSPALGVGGRIYIGCRGYFPEGHPFFAADRYTGQVLNLIRFTGFPISPVVDSLGMVWSGSLEYISSYVGYHATFSFDFSSANSISLVPAGSVTIDRNRETILAPSIDRWAQQSIQSVGQSKWSVPIGSTQPTLDSDGNIFMGIGHGVVRLNRETGVREWEVSLPDIVVTPPVVGLNNTLYVATTSGQVYSISGTSSKPKTAAVLVHGWCSDPGAFGQMGNALENAGIVVGRPFDYSAFTATGGKDGPSLRELAGRLGDWIENERARLGMDKIDVVAHSAGGIIARAWIAGLATSGPPYSGQIDRLITIATPHYGTHAGRAWTTIMRAAKCAANQAQELEFGSRLISDLHDAWHVLPSGDRKDLTGQMLSIAGTRQSPESRGWCEPFGAFPGDPIGRACLDGLVDVSSATLPEADASLIRYVPYAHSDQFGQFFAAAPWTLNDIGIASVPADAETHLTFRAVKAFLLRQPLPAQSELLQISEAQLARLRGLVLLRFYAEGDTSQELIPGPPVQGLPGALYPGGGSLDSNKDGGLTCHGCDPGILMLIGKKGYENPPLISIEPKTGKPTVPNKTALRRK